MRTRADERGWAGRLLVWVAVLSLVGAGVVAWRLDLVGPWYDYFVREEPVAQGPEAVPPPPQLDLPGYAAPAPVALPLESDARVSAAEVEAAVAPYLANPKLGRHLLAAVADLETGRQILKMGNGAAIPASTTKVLTGLAALSALGPEARFATRVVSGGAGRIVLVGGGDPYLMAEPAGSDEATYPERADVTTLAQLTAARLREQGRTRVELGYDDAYFAGPRVNPAWKPSYITEEIVSPITALWVDQGRPESGSGRVADPSLAAAEAFARALTEAGIEVVGPPSYGLAAPGGRRLAAVRSAPVREIVERVVEVSDNEAAEVLAHHVGRAVTGTGSFTDGSTGILRTLGDLGVPTDGVELYDGSGLSRENRITPAALIAALRLAVDPARPELRPVVTGLPVAGFSGSLTNRFDEAFPDARGLVRAKTGTLTAVSSLAGVVVDQDGNQMAFVLMVDRVKKPNETAAQDALDVAAGALGACHCARGPT